MNILLGNPIIFRYELLVSGRVMSEIAQRLDQPHFFLNGSISFQNNACSGVRGVMDDPTGFFKYMASCKPSASFLSPVINVVSIL